MQRLRLTWRACCLKCPSCGEGRLFAGWFRMHKACSHCGMEFQREPGYFLGSIYFNYGVTALLVTAAFFSLFLLAGISPDALLWPLTAFCVLFPLWFFRYARALWLAMDISFDPHTKSDERRFQAASRSSLAEPSGRAQAERGQVN